MKHKDGYLKPICIEMERNKKNKTQRKVRLDLREAMKTKRTLTNRKKTSLRGRSKMTSPEGGGREVVKIGIFW